MMKGCGQWTLFYGLEDFRPVQQESKLWTPAQNPQRFWDSEVLAIVKILAPETHCPSENNNKKWSSLAHNVVMHPNDAL